jgi:WD40 repeat protein
MVIAINMRTSVSMEPPQKNQPLSLKNLCLSASINRFLSTCDESTLSSIHTSDGEELLKKVTTFLALFPKELRDPLLRCALQRGMPKKLSKLYTIYAISSDNRQAVGVLSNADKTAVAVKNNTLTPLTVSNPTYVTQAAISPDQKRFVIRTLDNTLHMYNHHSTAPYATVRVPALYGSLCFVDTNMVALPLWGSIELFDINTYQQEKIIDLKGDSKKIAVLNSGNTIAATGVNEIFDQHEHIAMLNLATKQLITIPMKEISTFIKTFIAHPRLPLLGIASGNTAYIYDTNGPDNTIPKKLFNLTGTMETFTFHPTINQCLSITMQFYPIVQLWNLTKKEVVFSIPITNLSSDKNLTLPFISWSHHGDSLIIASNDGILTLDPRCWLFYRLLKKIKKLKKTNT